MRTVVWWKLFATLVVLAWATVELMPFKNKPFTDYLKSQVSAHPEVFDQLSQQAEAIKANHSGISDLATFLQVARSNRQDLNLFFPQLNLADVKNLNQRNEILLNYYYQKSQSPLKLGLDLQGGVAFTLKVDDAVFEADNDFENAQRLEKAIDIMHERVNGLGVSEPVIRAVGQDRIDVQLPGITTQGNPDAIQALQKPAKLTFHRVHRSKIPTENSALTDVPGYTIMEEEDINPMTGEIEVSRLWVKRIPDLGGDSVASAFASIAENGAYQINLNFTSEGAQRFKALTGQIAKENGELAYANLPDNAYGKYGRLAIVLDGKLYSAPRVTEAIPDGHARISGRFSQREALELANVLNNPLEFALTVEQMYEVGPSLAEDARVASLYASILGVGLVAAFMVGYYGLSGLVAMVAVALNILMTLGAMSMLGATLTLPGVAALVLNVGMAVDAHILIFERMKEKLHLGKSLKTALAAGHQRAFATILDSNLTTLLVGIILIVLGTGSIKGFGITLSLGILATLFSAMVISHMLLEVMIESKCITKMPTFTFYKAARFNFMRVRFGMMGVAGVILLMGLVGVGMRGESMLGIDFRGGKELTLSFAEPVALGKISSAFERFDLQGIVPVYKKLIGDMGETLTLRLSEQDPQSIVEILQSEFPDADFQLIGETQIGAAVSHHLQVNALWAVCAALLGILVYVAFRFQISYGIGAALSTTYDMIASVGLFVLMGVQLTAAIVASILMIVGYSINDKIVVFDRIREELKLNPALKLWDIIHLAINKTLSRTTLTSLTTFLSALALYIFGAGEIHDFALLFMIGIVVGTWSSIFIASPIFYFWNKGDRRQIESQEISPQYEWDASSKASR